MFLKKVIPCVMVALVSTFISGCVMAERGHHRCPSSDWHRHHASSQNDKGCSQHARPTASENNASQHLGPPQATDSAIQHLGPPPAGNYCLTRLFMIHALHWHPINHSWFTERRHAQMPYETYLNTELIRKGCNNSSWPAPKAYLPSCHHLCLAYS